MPRILFVKTSSLGDVVHHCPAVSDAAARNPDAEIHWVVEESFAGVAAMHPAVRRVIPVALRRWRAAPWRREVWSEAAAFRRAVGAEHYDAVIDTQGLVKSAVVARLARGRRHGYDRASAREPLAALFYDVRHAVARGLHAVERNRLLTGAALGYRAEGDCDYGLRPGAGESGGGRVTPYAVLLTMTSRADKLWDEGAWVELGRALAERGVGSFLPWGSETERLRCERLAAAIEGAQVPPRMPLDALARLMRGARAAIGVDTGLVHLAVAVGAATVGVYCGSDPALTGLYGGARATSLGGAGAPPSPAEVLAAVEALW